jgi:hypothetical protein
MNEGSGFQPAMMLHGPTKKKILAKKKKKNEGLWDNIHAKRRRGERMRKPGEKGAPTADALRRARGEQKEEVTTTANIPNPAVTSQGPVVAFLDRRSKKKKKLLKKFREYNKEKGIE